MILLAGFIFIFLSILLRQTIAQPQPSPTIPGIYFCDEDDVKIAPDFSGKASRKKSLEPSEQEIQRYFHHKDCGNLDKARKLGDSLGENILSFGSECDQEKMTPELVTHAMMLYLFVAEHCLLSSISDPILNKLILAQMNDTISQTLPDFYTNVCQYRSYTLYKLCLQEEEGQSEEHQAEHIGSCWAHMVGNENDPQLRALGEKLYCGMYDRCQELLNSVSFCKV